ncbi:hypothetical protein [uncultured Paludibaculum sp.]|uniref:hypothetical protein n=1 Tax=uncultured Paludibaculum sp. TaxID=1765020 RepID=UPI002AABE73F|nr:hypothetical protein [uncultured Paludibaculum sp.]
MKSLIALYRQAVRNMWPALIPGLPAFGDKLTPAKLDSTDRRDSISEARHILWMLDVMEATVDTYAGHPIAKALAAGKLNRWLGFVQGYLWRADVYSLDELRDQTRKALNE